MEIDKMQDEFLKRQNEFKNKICTCDTFDYNSLKLVAGIDLAYWNDKIGNEQAVCCIVVIDYKSHEVVEKKHYSGKIDVPYMPGFLAFRELPLVLKTAELLETSPDIFIFDGNGYLHPRHMGIATHASFYLNKPTIGVAKTYFRVDDQTDFSMLDNSAGSFTNISINCEVYGRALRTHCDVKPVFVSIGNYICLDTACKIALDLTGKESHIPIPTRLADLETHVMRRMISDEQL